VSNVSDEALESQWEALLAAEAKRSRQINAEIRRFALFPINDTILNDDIPYSIKDRLQRRFAELADSFEEQLRQFSSDLAAIEGPLEVRAAE
jgi:hypothetical protein